MKRKDESREEGEGGSGRGKVGRWLDGHQGDTRGWERRAGMILEVKLRNFMCHEVYSFQPNQRLNFLCGENGSGKSAVLTAIVFGLGGSARTSSRGNSNKGFIRTGQTSAVVEIKLCNEGEKAYKPEVYGDSITVMRTVTNSSSTYKLKDHRGHVVVEKKVKEELDRVLMSFNIQVDNPIAVLNQDTAKTFLFKCEPDKLYTFFMRATQLETCKADYNAAALEKTTAEKHLEEKKASLPELKKELAKWEKKYEFHQNLNVRKQDVKVKKAELSWAVVRDKEMEASTAEEEAEEQKKKISKCEQTIGEYSTKEKSLREEKMGIEAEIQKLADTREEETNKLEQLKKDSDMKREKARALKKTLGELERQRDKVSRRAKTLVDEINRLRANASEYEEKHKERKREISSLENQAVSLNAQIDTTSNHSNQLRENLKSVEQQEAQAMTDLKRHQGKVTKSKTELQGLRNSGNDKLATFGAWMPRLVQEVARCRGFKKAPIGPLGAHINLREGCDERLGRAVEGELAGGITAFLCDNSKDQRLLYELFNKLQLRSKPVIYTCSYTENRHNVGANKVRSNQYKTLIDCVDIEDTNVFNRLIDSFSLERILFIPTEEEAQTLLSSTQTVPKNLLHAVVPNYQYYPAPNYRSYYKQDKTRGVLKASVEELLNQLEEQVRNDEEVMVNYEAKVREIKEEKKRFDGLIREEDIKVRRIREQIRKINSSITNLRNEEENEAPVDVAALEDDHLSAQEEIEKLEENIDEEKCKTDDVINVAEVAKKLYDEAFQENQKKMEGLTPLETRLEGVENGIKKAKKDQNHYQAKIIEYKQKYDQCQGELDEKRKVIEEEINRAKNWSEERVESRKKVDSLKREIIKMEESLKRQEETQESREVVTDEYTRLKSVYSRADWQVKRMTNTVEFLGDMLTKRRTGFKVILRSTSKNISRNFTTQLQARNYIGQLDFDHKDHTLTIAVNPDSNANAAALDIRRDIRSLSGGEKSYSSVSLILALWNAMSPPFRILDEFDVFMDAVNRRVSLNNIIDYATEDRKYQFVFLTPLNTDNIDVGNDLKIIKLSKRAAR